MTKTCKTCKLPKPYRDFSKRDDCANGRNPHCKDCKNTKQKLKFKTDPVAFLARKNACKAYEKTKQGFLMRIYRNMKSRITGVQKLKFHLYEGKFLLGKDKFYEWALANPEYHRLFAEYEKSGYSRKLAPSVDRVDSSKGYMLDNMEFITHSENSRRGNASRFNKTKA